MGAAPPVISVLMPVFNCEAYVAEAVDSVLAQTFRDYEFLIVDDGSTDRSGRLLEDFATRDQRIRLISRPNTGITRALNEMIGLARGKYLARMDADDVCVADRFARQADYLDSHPECVVVGSRVMLMDPYGSPVARSGHSLTHREIDRELMTRSGWAVVHPSVMMRRDAVVAVGGYDERWRHCEDHDLFLRLAEVGRVANLHEVLLWYRRHYASINYNHAREQAERMEALQREAHRRRGIEIPGGWKHEPWNPPSTAEQSRLWGWAALKVGNVGIARRHALMPCTCRRRVPIRGGCSTSPCADTELVYGGRRSKSSFWHRSGEAGEFAQKLFDVPERPRHVGGPDGRPNRLAAVGDRRHAGVRGTGRVGVRALQLVPLGERARATRLLGPR